MTLPVLQLMIGIGFGVLGFLFLRSRMLPAASHNEGPSERTYNDDNSYSGGYERRRRRRRSNHSQPGDKCVICLREMQSHVDMYFLKCRHALHYNCYTDCIKHDKRCPLCREPM